MNAKQRRIWRRGFDHKVILEYKVIFDSDITYWSEYEARAWCREIFGEDFKDWGHIHGEGIFYFRKPEHATLFRLKWT